MSRGLFQKVQQEAILPPNPLMYLQRTLVFSYRNQIGYFPMKLAYHAFPQQIIRSTLWRLSHLAQPYNKQDHALTFKILAVFVVFFILLVFIVTAKQIAGQEDIGLVISLITIILPFLYIQGKLMSRKSKVLLQGEASVRKFISDEMVMHYVPRNTTIEGSLKCLCIKING